MIQKNVITPLILILFVIFTMTGCSGGSSGDSGGSTTSPPTGSPSLEVLPASFDFGAVTTNNSPAPLEVRIKNNGSAALVVSNIILSDHDNFSLNTNGGFKPCSSGSPTIAAADSCTFEIAFQPAANATYAANIRIHSNDGSSQVFTLPITGTSQPVEALTVRINQLETSCPTDTVNAYVSVTDQGGYPLSGLAQADFTVTEGGNLIQITTSTYIEVAYEDIAIAAVMDYSSSLTDQPEAIADMESGFVNLFNDFRATDVAEILKFDQEFAVVQPFTSDKAALTAAVSAAFDMGVETRLYDTVFKAVDDTALRTNYRRAVIVANDGEDTVSTHSLDEVINNANTKGVPIFTILIGTARDRTTLERMANETGGQFFEAQTSQNLATIYQQLSSILFKKQYILTFDQQQLGEGATADLIIRANSQGIQGDDIKIITSCN